MKKASKLFVVQGYYKGKTMSAKRNHEGECPPNGSDYHGRCLGDCFECDEHLLATGRYTVFCPACDCCEECGCPNVDGFAHYADCTEVEDEV